MKTKTHKLVVIIALLSLITFALTACDDGGSTGNGGGTTAFGEKLELSGQVSTEKWNDTYTSVSYENFSGDLTINDSNGGSGEVTGGKLSYTIETPNSLNSIQYLVEDLFWYYDVSVNPENTQCYIIWNLAVSNGELSRERQSVSVSSSSFSQSDDKVYYVYVDKDVTINGKGGTFDETNEYYDDYKETYIMKDFNFELKTGWNAVRGQSSANGTYSGSVSDPTGLNVTFTTTYSLANPSSLRWVYYDWNDYYYSVKPIDPSLSRIFR